jgi:DNA-binding transcriptional regulator YhcF (GntR family)
MAPNMTGSKPKSNPSGTFTAAKERWLLHVARHPNLSGADQAVAIALSCYMNSKTHDAWPSLKRLADDINRDRSTVSRSLKRLEHLALLSIVHGRGRKKCNRYKPRMGNIDNPACLKRSTSLRGKVLRSHMKKAANSHTKGCEFAARTLEEESMNLGAEATEAGQCLSGEIPPSTPLSLSG